jgi:hypothetical protein
MECRLVEDRPLRDRLTAYVFDTDSNLYWLHDGKLFRAGAQDLGGFVWWSRQALGVSPANPTGDANHNATADLSDYVTDRAGPSPVSVDLDNSGAKLTATVGSNVPRDVCVRIEVQDFAGSWQPVGTWAGGLWAGDNLSTGVAVKRVWAQPIQYRAVYSWLGREE